MIVNVNEQIVDNVLKDKKVIYPDVCFCDTCTDDMKALALNKLHPKYVSTTKGELFSRTANIMQQQNKTDTDIAVIQAIEYVSQHPRHKGGWN
ncbi:hypothetical protein FACS1894132_12030 [Clostridia bacterium]|nr:hypothetical protein FACS1894132_12030 [Clostridia bacterium]